MRARDCRLLDLNYVAHALVTCGETGVNLVLEAIDPLATSAP
jgi:hypothetical protein